MTSRPPDGQLFAEEVAFVLKTSTGKVMRRELKTLDG